MGSRGPTVSPPQPSTTSFGSTWRAEPPALEAHTASCRAGRREQFFLLFFGNFHAALFLSEDWWDLFTAPLLISELICDAVIGSAATRGSTVAIPPHAGALPAATEQPLRPGPGALPWD